MSRSGKAFELGGIVVPIHAALDLQQRIEPIGGSTPLRLGLGALVKQTTWGKRRVTLSASGWCPPGLDSLAWDTPLTLKCGLPESITTAALVIEWEMKIDDIKEFIFPHPSVAEIIREALFKL